MTAHDIVPLVWILAVVGAAFVLRLVAHGAYLLAAWAYDEIRFTLAIRRARREDRESEAKQ